ncbi:MAG: GNAT family N-acetyltransferase [Methyloceanibacter sp.]|uniref:GNAT family N-acetyltransferase n=1 Tax=Methyloceanibacter sp. TaxID=1965321 RepID=UPI003D9B6F15
MPFASAISVREALLGDAAIMAAIHSACFPRCWDEAAFAQLLAEPLCLSLLAAAQGDNSPQAFVIVRGVADQAELLTLAVLPDNRRQGLARALVGASAAACREAGAKRLFFEVEDGNDAALLLYRSFGAVAVGSRPAYYENGADAAILSLALSGRGPDDAASRAPTPQFRRP